MGLAFVPAPVATLPWRMLGVVTALGLAGVIALYSAAGGFMMPWALPHLIRFLVFLGMALALARIRVQTFHDFAFFAYGGGILLLILTLMLGVIGGGARSWLELGVVRLQPSELMKPIIVLTLARFYAHVPPAEIRRLWAMWPLALILGPPILLILLQPDLGTTMLIVLNTIALMFLAGLPLRLFIGGALAVGAALPIVYNFLLLPHQQERVLIFLNPETDPLGAGYHLTQSKIAIGSGGVFGKGFLNGTQSHLHYLPEQHTDFIFSAIAEEWGLIGGCVLILLFFLLLRWGMGVALEAKGRFERLAAAGLTLTIFFYIAVNLMMVMGLAPVVGIPLPLVSYGGSAMLTVMICLGMLMSIERQNRGEGRR
ncbi:MAG TPA: rod shape-determining protein RodA [Allosphingosinicella sp.]